jgi:hypothetical protein
MRKIEWRIARVPMNDEAATRFVQILAAGLERRLDKRVDFPSNLRITTTCPDDGAARDGGK